MKKTYKVHMLAFGAPGQIREVTVFDEFDSTTPVNEVLELIYKYGQNDFQPQECCSVSMGDVIEYEGAYYLILGTGFIHLSVEGFEAYKKIDRSERISIIFAM
jgi:hypothetical protein